DFLLAPGADASAIRLRYDGARALRLKENGEMEATTDFGIVHEAAPYSYQEIGGKRVAVEAAYRLIGRDSYGFRLGPHDPTRPVVIDPCLSVEYATFLGGGGYDVVTNVAADSAGFAYATGFTRAPDFPLLPEVDTIDQDNYVFISKITPDGALVYSTFIAQAYDSAYSSTVTNLIYESIGEDVEATKNGEAVIALSTNRENLATTANAYKRQLTKNDINGPCGPAVFRNFDVYVARLDISGKLKWGTYLGNTNNDYLSDIALDNNENVYLTGFTYGATCVSGSDPAGDKLTFPITGTPGAFTSADTLRNLDAYVTVLNADGRNLRFSALYGGTGNDVPSKIVVDQAGKIYIFGSTNSTNLPTSLNAFQRTRATGATAGTYDLFLAKIDPVTENLDYSSYICDNGPGRIGLGFGGFSPRPFDETIDGFDRRDRLQGMMLDRTNGTLILAGTTRSGTLPTTTGVIGPGSRGPNGVDESANDAYLIRFSTAPAGIVAATYLGGSDFDGLGGIGFDRFGDIAVSISTKSTDFPLSAVAIQQSLRGKVDGAITTISPDFRQLTYSSYYGGSATPGDRLWEQIVAGLTVDKDGGIYIYGATSSRDFPLSQHPISKDEDYYQGYLVKFSAPSAAKIGLGLSL
ncbi:MAG: SBBP repeat-containing protein, partial [Bacteroidota bacterium]